MKQKTYEMNINRADFLPIYQAVHNSPYSPRCCPPEQVKRMLEGKFSHIYDCLLHKEPIGMPEDWQQDSDAVIRASMTPIIAAIIAELPAIRQAMELPPQKVESVIKSSFVNKMMKILYKTGMFFWVYELETARYAIYRENAGDTLKVPTSDLKTAIQVAIMATETAVKAHTLKGQQRESEVLTFYVSDEAFYKEFTDPEGLEELKAFAGAARFYLNVVYVTEAENLAKKKAIR